MNEVYNGTFLFTWKIENCGGGSLDAVIKQLKDLGVKGLLVKFADGNLVNDPVSQSFMDNFKRVVQPLKAAGFTVGGWIYQYLTDPAGEVDACSQAIEAGADFIVLDAEVEVYGKRDQVAQFGQLFRSKYPSIKVGLSSFAIADYHQEVPFDQYNTFVDFMMPQIYWATMGWGINSAFNASIQSYKKYGKPIAPTGQSYDSASTNDIKQFVTLCEQNGYQSISWWDLDSATTVQLEAIKENIISPPTEVSKQTIPAYMPKDIPNDGDVWYVNSGALKYVLENGLMSVDENGNFNPEQPITRSVLAQALYNVFHEKK